MTAGKTHAWSCRFDTAGTKLILRGTAKMTTTDPYPVAMPNPPAVFAAVLADRLAQAGVTVEGKLRVDLDPAAPRGPAPTDTLIATETTPLSAAMGRANRESLNMMAECLYLRSAVTDEAPATWNTAAATACKVLCRDYGLAGEKLAISDGSGLSKLNRVSPAAICSLLAALRQQEVFVGSLAVSGKSGSMARRLDGAGVRGRVLGKTGSLAGASALSGYVLDADDAPAVAFSVITNGRTNGKTFSAKAAEDAIAEALAAFVDAAKAE